MVTARRISASLAAMLLCGVPPLCEKIVGGVEEAALRHALAAVPGLTVGGFGLDRSAGRLSLHALSFSNPGFKLDIGNVSMPEPRGWFPALVGPARAQTGLATVDDIRLEFGRSVYLIPHLEGRGTSLSATDLGALFDPQKPDTLQQRLARFTAAELNAPEVAILPHGAGGAESSGRVKVRDLTMTGVSAGRIDWLAAKAISFADTRAASAGNTFEAGRVEASHVNLPLAARIIEGSRSDASAQPQRIYADLTVEAVKIKTSPALELSIGSIRSDGVRGRPLLIPPSRIDQLSGMPADQRSPEERKQLADALADAFESFAMDRLDIRDVFLADTGEKPASMRLGLLLVRGGQVSKVRSVALENFAFSIQGVTASFDRFAIDGYDQSRLLATISEQGVSTDPEAMKSQFGRVAPSLAGISVHGVRIDAPAEDLKGNMKAGTRTVFDMPVAEMKMSSNAERTATDSSAYARAVYEIASDSVDPGLRNLLQAGFSRFDFSTNYAMHWDAGAREAKLDRLEVGAAHLGSVALNGTFDEIAPDLFDAGQDGKTAALAAQNIRMRELGLHLTDDGLAEKALDVAATSAGVSVPVYKAELKGQAEVAVLKILGDTPAASRVNKAVSAFISDPKVLRVSVKAPAGLSLKSVTDTDDMRALLDRLEIDASAGP